MVLDGSPGEDEALGDLGGCEVLDRQISDLSLPSGQRHRLFGRSQQPWCSYLEDRSTKALILLDQGGCSPVRAHPPERVDRCSCRLSSLDTEAELSPALSRLRQLLGVAGQHTARM